MKLICGNAGLSDLKSSLSESDPASSSHWDYYHRDFASNSNGTSLSGLEGFGSISRRSRFRQVAHNIMLSPWRKSLKLRPEFGDILALTKMIACRQKRCLDLDMFRQSQTLAFIDDHRPGIIRNVGTWVVIGDGFGVLASLLLLVNNQSRFILINLDRSLLAVLAYVRMVFPERFDAMTRLVQSREELASALEPGQFDSDPPRLIAIRARNQDLLSGVPADVFINVASMQEMRMTDIRGYFSSMRTIAERKEVIFYCCNREEKQHPDGTSVRFADYPWREDDDVLVDGLCPWHDRFYSLRPPRYHFYEGVHLHRLVRIAPWTPEGLSS